MSDQSASHFAEKALDGCQSEHSPGSNPECVHVPAGGHPPVAKFDGDPLVPPRAEYGRVEVIKGDARDLPLTDASVDLIVTSPPYYKQRAYDGLPLDGQIGQERTPAEFVDSLVSVTEEYLRVLRPTGSLWVNLGEKYLDRGLSGIPWRYALRCMDDIGLLLRAEVVWSKPNAYIDAKARDRARRTHETWLHFARNAGRLMTADKPTTGAGVRLSDAEREALGTWLRHRGVYSFGLLVDIADCVERILTARASTAQDVGAGEVERAIRVLLPGLRVANYVERWAKGSPAVWALTTLCEFVGEDVEAAGELIDPDVPTAHERRPAGEAGEVERLRADWEAAVLQRFVDTMPATRETPDFVQAISNAMLHTRAALDQANGGQS